jgi:hypothetical protein
MADAADFEPAHENTMPLFSMGHLGISPGAFSALLSLGLNPGVFRSRQDAVGHY